MDLLVVRHAIAAAGDDDDARPLTGPGRRRFARIARGIARRGPPVEILLHSPKVRAVETARLMQGICAATEASALLVATPGEALLARLAACSHAAVVGHSPHLEELLSLLLIGDVGRDVFDLRKGGWAWLVGEARPAGMRLRAFVPPRLARPEL